MAAMQAVGFDGPFTTKHLESAMRWGFPRLAEAAAGTPTAEYVDAVCEAAWDQHRNLWARDVPGYDEVVELAGSTNGWAWTAAVVEDPRPRAAMFDARYKQACRHAAEHYGRLGKDGGEPAVNKAFAELCDVWLEVDGASVRLAGWVVRPVMFKYLNWRLLDAAAAHDAAARAADDMPFVPLSLVIEAGEHGVSPMIGVETTIDDLGVESARWHVAAGAMSAEHPVKVRSARAGASQTKLDLTYRAAIRTLERGAAHAEVRAAFAQDPLLCCFQSLTEVAVGTWSRFDRDKLPTREVLDRVARETRELGVANAEWFQAVEARRKELNDKHRLLHGISGMVTAAWVAAGGTE